MSTLLDNLINARYYEVDGVVQERRQKVNFAGGVTATHDATTDTMTLTFAPEGVTTYSVTTTDDSGNTVTQLACAMNETVTAVVTATGHGEDGLGRMIVATVHGSYNDGGTDHGGGEMYNSTDKEADQASFTLADDDGAGWDLVLTGLPAIEVTWTIKIEAQRAAHAYTGGGA